MTVVQKQTSLEPEGERDSEPALARSSPALTYRDWIILATFTLLILTPTLIVPIGPNQSALACSARRILQGTEPYRDVTFMFPGSSLLYAAAFRLFGEPDVSIRVMDIAWCVATAIALYSVARQLFDRAIALTAALFYPLMYLETGYLRYAETDVFMNLPILIAIFCWFRGAQTHRTMWAIAGGAFVGVAMLFRVSAGAAFLSLPAIYWMVSDDRARAHAMIRATASALLGMFGFLAVAAFVLLREPYRGHDFWSTWTTVVPFHVNVQQLERPNLALIAILAGAYFLVADNNYLVATCGVLGLLVIAAVGRSRRPFLFPVAYLAVAVLIVSAQRRFSTYHWLPTIPAWCWIAACSLELRHQFERIEAAKKKLIVGAYAALGLAVIVFSAKTVLLRYRDLITYARAPASPGYLREFSTEPPFIAYSALDEWRAAQYIARRTKSDDALFIWGFAPGVYLWSDRDTPTPLMYHIYLEAPRFPPHWRQEYLNSVLQARPPFIIIRRDSPPKKAGVRWHDASADVNALPELRDFVQDRYYFDRKFGYLYLYRLRWHEGRS